MIYEFDRYVRGQLMAEGARISKASSLDDAMDRAREMFACGALPGEMAVTRFVLTATWDRSGEAGETRSGSIHESPVRRQAQSPNRR